MAARFQPLGVALLPTQLWKSYLDERRLAVRSLRPDHPSRAALHNTFERALVSMHKVGAGGGRRRCVAAPAAARLHTSSRQACCPPPGLTARWVSAAPPLPRRCRASGWTTWSC
jgi:hypothetical protein